jgi:hypothetical protein
LLCFSTSAVAFGTYLSAFQSQYPSSTTGTTAWSSTSARCDVCHSSGGGTDLNPYGEAFAAAGHNFAALEGLTNSDGSAGTNLEEINASTQPGWKPGATNTLYDIASADSGVVVTTTASPPTALIGSADNTSTLPTVTISATTPNASEAGPTAGQFTVTRTASTASALTVNYTIGGTATNTTDYATLSGSVTIGAGSATALITVTPVDDALVEGSETVILTLSANAAYTVGSPNSATVTIADNDSVTSPPPPPTGPMIALDLAKVDFGQVQINTTATRTALVHNIGNADLNVTGITLCPGTSSEYTWSPDTFAVAPGSSQTLTVFYNPLDQTTDNGCLQIASNDTTQNPENLSVAGVGIVPSGGALLDIDIVRLGVDQKIDLTRPKPVKIQLLVKQAHSGEGTAQATITGTQNNVDIYNETLPITIQASSSTSKRQHSSKAAMQTLAFPSYTPVAEGDIVWTATISDPDPDFDEATATTKVTLGKGHKNHGGDDRGNQSGDD